MKGRRIRVVAQWRYVGCPDAFGTEIVVDNLCCNRKCTCQINSQQVGVSTQTFKDQLVIDFSNIIEPQIKSYNCSLNELDDCEERCFQQVQEYLGKIQPIDYNSDGNRQNLNLFGNDLEAASTVTRN